MADGDHRPRVDFNASPVGRRLALCGELAAMKRGTANITPARRHKARERAHAILRLLLPGELAGARATDELMAMESGRRLFAGFIEAAAAGDAADRVRAAVLLRDLRNMADHAQLDGLGPSVAQKWPEAPEDFQTYDRDRWYYVNTPAAPVVAEAKVRGALPEGLSARAKSAVDDAFWPRTYDAETDAKVAPEAAAALKAAQAKQREVFERLHAVSMRTTTPGSSEAEESRREEDALTALWRAGNETVAQAAADVRNAYALHAEKNRAVIGATVAGYRDDLAAASPVSEERAAEWSTRQVVITKAAAARLKKLGYAPAQVVKDAAEFYRIANGRIEKVVIDSKGDRRANAGGIGAHGQAGRINLGSAFDKRVLWHELGHHIESDPMAAMAARLFIQSRAEGERMHTLRSLTGSKFYDASETAYKDGFFDPYVGKVYRDGATELFSMVMESLSSPFLLARRIAVDPESFEFVTGYLARPRDALDELHLAMRQSTRETGEGAAQAGEDDAATKVAAAAAGVPYVSADRSPVPPALAAAVATGWKVEGYLPPEAGVTYALIRLRMRSPETRRVGWHLMTVVHDEAQSGRLLMGRIGYSPKEPEIARIALQLRKETGTEFWPKAIREGNFTLENGP